jgi:uncharacterized membrane protein (UPF0127 family)/protein-S-isoprenylcysteine O-methyltransferase Ste14
MENVVYCCAAALLVAAAFVVFRVLVRRDYRLSGRLMWHSSLLELLVWTAYMSFPYLYSPRGWPYLWSPEVPVGALLRIVGVVCIAVGLVASFGTMAWFGLRRAFGVHVEGLVQGGPYRATRNPQMVGFGLVVLGVLASWPSWRTAGWVVLFGVIGHLMVLTEEEHLLRAHGEAYARYRRRVPRYLGAWWRRAAAEDTRPRPHSRALLALALLALAGCRRAPRAQDEADLHILDFDSATVRLVSGGDTIPLSLELAVSEEQQQLGLMERRHLPERAGMLFVYVTTQPPDAGFWMFRTRIPLDIAFLDSTGAIRTVLHMAPCETDFPEACPIYRPGIPYRYALELNAGALRRLGIDASARLLVGDVARRGGGARR